MKRIFFIVATIAFFLNACGPQAIPTIDPVQAQVSVIAAANTIVAMTMMPISTPFVMPTGNFQMSWDTSQYFAGGGLVTIYKQGLIYTEKEFFSDGSGGMMGITVTPQGTNLKIVEADMAGGDYMLISSSDGSLSYCDNQGLIYRVPLFKMNTSQ